MQPQPLQSKQTKIVGSIYHSSQAGGRQAASMTSRPRRVGRPIAAASSAAQSPMAKSQEQQRAARAPIKRPESSDEDENNNPHRAPTSAGTRQQPQQLHKWKRSHCSSVNLRSCNSGPQQQQLASCCVTQSTKSAKVIGGAAADHPKRAQPSASSVKRALEQEAHVQRLARPAPTPPSEFRKPLAQVNRLRWKSSTSALNCNTAATARWQSASTATRSSPRSHLISEQVSSRGQWCCELPHHATAAHLNTRRQSNLAPLFNRVHQDLNGLRHKRAVSSLSLANASARQSSGDKSARAISTKASETSTKAAHRSSSSSTNRRGEPKPQAISALERAPQASSQVTNSRLRQGALFARRQLNLLPSQTLAAPPTPPRLAESRDPGRRCARAQSVAPAGGRPGASKVQANSPASKPGTAAEARRRATRQVIVVAAPRNTSGDSRPLGLVKAEKKASHLTSSSSSLSLSAFVVKRPRQQQHSSSTSSSCSSISTASRRWSSSSGADSPSLSQSCTQLTSHPAHWPHGSIEHQAASPRPSIGGNSKTTSEHFGPASGRANERRPSSTDECEQRTRFVQPTNGQLHEPKQANGQANDFDSTKQHFDQPDYLLGTTPLSDFNHSTHSIEPSDKSQAHSSASESGCAAQHAFLVQSDEKEPIDQQVSPRATIESSQLEEDADIVAIGCSPVASVIAAPSKLSLSPTTTIDNFTISHEATSQALAQHGTMATSGPGCNTNEYQLIVTSNNHDAARDRSNDQEAGVQEKNVDMQISLGGDVENINNNIDVNDPHQAAVMNKGLMSPLDLSSKTFGANVVPQEPVCVKNQPLGLHQSMNIAAGSEQPTQSAKSISGQGAAIEGPFCAIDLTIAGERRDSSQNVAQNASSGEPLSEQNVIAEQQKMAEIPIRLEPISDFYDLESRPFARGKFAQVKRCTRKSATPSMTLGECYAAKCIKKRRRLVDIRHEILLEIEALKLSFETKHIVRLYEVYETQTEMVLVLEMAKGGELQRVLDDEEQIEEPLVRKMIDQILEGLIHLHDKEIAHLDIKPQNLLLSKPFPDGDIKLCDFGISRRISKDCEIREICGTPDYVAPEILRYDPISLATDMWSLGVLTYVLLSGYSPFGSDNKQQTFCNITQATLDFPQDIFAKISSEAVDFVRKLIVREPAERLTSRQAKQHHWISGNRRAG